MQTPELHVHAIIYFSYDVASFLYRGHTIGKSKTCIYAFTPVALYGLRIPLIYCKRELYIIKCNLT